jgi:hypothetical protein
MVPKLVQEQRKQEPGMKEAAMRMILISLSTRKRWFAFILWHALEKIPNWLTTRSTQMTSSPSDSKIHGHYQEISSVMVIFGVLTKLIGMNP